MAASWRWTSIPTIAAIRTALAAILPGTTVRKVGRRGETLFYYAPQITVSKRWLIDGEVICELIGPGRQTVLPPTIHPDTNAPYRWTGTEGLDAVKPDELPALPADIVEQINTALAAFGYAGEKAEPVVAAEDTPHRELNDAAMANLAAWVPALPLYRLKAARGGYEAAPTWRPSSSGKSDDERELQPRRSIPKGIRDFGADVGYTPLDLVMVGARLRSRSRLWLPGRAAWLVERRDDRAARRYGAAGRKPSRRRS